ncbi:MAG: hypothetical protein FJY95_04035 [Candidatus Handelsmanbacteria bacterium]|nr:hypothetical protein [Candidatus Handelsmanbacteria bacterium]
MALLRHLALRCRDVERSRLEEAEEYIHFFGVLVEDLEATWGRLRALWAHIEKTVKARDPLDAAAPPRIAFKTLDPDGNVIDVSADRGEWRGVAV